MRIGFIGLGNMGFPMARRLIQENHDVIAFDTSGAALESIVALGAQAASSSKEVSDRAETVMASLPSPAASLEVATGAAGVIEGSRVKRYVDLSTVGSGTAVQIHGLLAERNIAAIDSPVSGGVSGADRGALAVMVSGPRHEFDVVRTVLEAIGRPFYIGEQPGSAQTMKLANNMLAANVLVATAEVVVMGVKSGLDPGVMIEVLNAGSGATSASRDKFPRCDPSAHLRLRLCHRVDGQRCAAVSRRGQSARRAGRRRRSDRSTLGGRRARPRRRFRFHDGDQTARAGRRRDRGPVPRLGLRSCRCGSPTNAGDTYLRGLRMVLSRFKNETYPNDRNIPTTSADD